MPRMNNKGVDLLRDPIDRAQKMMEDQNESIAASLMPDRPNPTIKWLHDRGITLKELHKTPHLGIGD